MRGVADNSYLVCTEHGAAYVAVEVEIGDASPDWGKHRSLGEVQCPLGDHLLRSVDGDDYEDVKRGIVDRDEEDDDDDWGAEDVELPE